MNLKKEHIAVIVALVIAVIVIIILVITFVLLFTKSSDKSFTKQCLKAHNKHRSRHNAPDLEEDDDLSEEALKVAKDNAEKGILEHSGGDYGENLFMFSSSMKITDFNCTKAVDAWYNEYKLYDFDRGEYVPGAGHFTQVVWKNSQFLGCALASLRNSLVIACEYKPAGNVIGTFKENVHG